MLGRTGATPRIDIPTSFVASILQMTALASPILTRHLQEVLPTGPKLYKFATLRVAFKIIFETSCSQQQHLCKPPLRLDNYLTLKWLPWPMASVHLHPRSPVCLLCLQSPHIMNDGLS